MCLSQSLFLKEKKAFISVMCQLTVLGALLNLLAPKFPQYFLANGVVRNEQRAHSEQSYKPKHQCPFALHKTDGFWQKLTSE